MSVTPSYAFMARTGVTLHLPFFRACCMVTTSWVQQQLAHTVLATCRMLTCFGVVQFFLRLSEILLCHYMVAICDSQQRPAVFGTVHLVGLIILNTAANSSSSYIEVWLPHVQNETCSQCPPVAAVGSERCSEALIAQSSPPPPKCRCTCPETIGVRCEPRRLETSGADRPPVRMLNSS
jgi:hypothetical protein